MKLALSNATCPELDLETLLARSSAWGYEGIELSGLHGHMDLGPSSVLCSDPAAVRQALEQAGLTLVALNTRMSLCHGDRRALAGSSDRVLRALELAAEIGCECVVISGAPVARGTSKARALDQCTAILRSLATQAAHRSLTLALENAGDLSKSQDAWYVRDAAGAPALRLCANPVSAQAVGDPPSVVIKRLAGALALVHLADAEFGPHPGTHRYVVPGSGQVDLAHVIELLKGMAYRGWLTVHWPSGARADLPPADEVLPATAEYLRAQLEKAVVVLSAYKGDKHAPRFVSCGPRDEAARAGD